MNKSIKFFCILGLLNVLTYYFFQNSIILRVPLIIITLAYVMYMKKDEILAIMFFISNPGMYDDIGFKYILNVIILIFVIKKIIRGEIVLYKNVYICLLILFVQEIFLLVLYDAQIDNIVASISLFLTYVILIFMCKEKNNPVLFKEIYQSLACGMLISVIFGLIVAYKNFNGFSFPIWFRFAGMLRDPNYYSMINLILIFSSYKYMEITKKKINIYAIVFFVLGIFSISKMFLISTIIGLFFVFFKELMNKRKSFYFIKFIFYILIFIVLLICIINFYNEIIEFINLYLGRFINIDFTSGRAEIQSTILNEIGLKEILIGVGNGNYIEANSLNKAAHNTFLELFLSWGIIGIIIYIILIVNIIKLYKSDFKILKTHKSDATIIVFICCLMALSLLCADSFAILMTFLFLMRGCTNKIKKEGN